MGWVVNATPWSLYPRERDPVSIVWGGWVAPGPVWTGAKNFARSGKRFPDRAACSELLYRLSYSDPHIFCYYLYPFVYSTDIFHYYIQFSFFIGLKKISLVGVDGIVLVGRSIGILWTRWWILGSYKTRGVFWLTEEQIAFREGLPPVLFIPIMYSSLSSPVFIHITLYSFSIPCTNRCAVLQTDRHAE